MAQDYARADPAQAFAERRGISFAERVAEIVQAVPEKARGMFDGLRLAISNPDRSAEAPDRGRSIFADFRPAPRPQETERSGQLNPDLQSARAGGVRGAVARYANAPAPVQQPGPPGPTAIHPHPG